MGKEVKDSPPPVKNYPLLTGEEGADGSAERFPPPPSSVFMVPSEDLSHTLPFVHPADHLPQERGY